MIRACLCVAALAFGLVAIGQAGERSPLGVSLKDIEVADHWIYDDWPAAKAEAKKTGKPILAVIRCVPCPPGKDLDLKVMQPDEKMALIEKQFVCVRIIQTNSLDLKLFQYDYDMSWAAMFMNADGTIYGRYGSRDSSGKGSDSILSDSAFVKAAIRALDFHSGLKADHSGKWGTAPEYTKPTEIPGLTDRPASANTRQECIHCHMVKEFALRAKWEAGKLTKEDLYVYPMPRNIGLTMELDNDLKVKAVEEGSAARKGGIQVGDELVWMGGDMLTSMADIQFALNSAPNEGRLPGGVRRDGRLVSVLIPLSGDWKKSDIGWRASSWYALRQGVKFEPLPAADKKSRGINDDALAMVVKGLFGKGGPKVQQAGLKMNDVIVAVDDKTSAMTESDFLVYLRLTHGPKDSVKFTVLRGDERQDLTVPLW